MAFYYLTSYSAESVEVENYHEVAPQEQDVLGEQTQVDTLAVTTGAEKFEQLANEKVDTAKKVVLGGAATTETTSSVPATGATTITLALGASAVILSWGVYVIWANPRKLALNHFEKKAQQD